MPHEPEARSYVPTSKRCVARFRYSRSPFSLGTSRCRFLASIPHDVHVGLCVGLPPFASAWWRSDAESVIVRTYKPYYDYASFPPGHWLLANLANLVPMRECSGVVGEPCDLCERCDQFTTWLLEDGADPNPSAFDIPEPYRVDIDPDLLSKNICGLCGGFVD
jgi:hypothetical protein